MRFYDLLPGWLNRCSLAWSIALGAVIGLGLGAILLFGMGGVLGVGLGVLVLGAVVWIAQDAEPILVGEEPAIISEPQWLPSIDELLEVVELDGGIFRMGSPDRDAAALDLEKPQHDVTVSAFAISRCPVTRQLYRCLVDTTPVSWEESDQGDRLPASGLSWFEAAAFCNTLSNYFGLQPCYHIDGDHVEWDTNADGYRLPTEAEWEYACRAGTTTRWFFRDETAALDYDAWFREDSGGRAHVVGERMPNPWGLHDMIGNVMEWCWDWYGEYAGEEQRDPTGPLNGVARVLRGGWSDFGPVFLRSAFRDWGDPELQHEDIGFRYVRRLYR